MLVFDPDITLWFRDAIPWAGEFFRLITELGGELFYLVLILTGYWAYRKKDAIVVSFVLLFSLFTNYWLKTFIANPRPAVSYHYEGMEASNYSTPSGHAQNSASLFGWIGVKVQTPLMVIVSIILTLLVGLSRVYLGVHYLGDVLLGWGIGFITVFVLYRYEEKIRNQVAQVNDFYFYGFLAIIAIVSLLVSTFLIPLPPGDNFGAVGGLILGLAIALPLESRLVNFSPNPEETERWKLAVRVILGLLLVVLVMMGLSPIMPTENVMLRTLRYALTAFVGVFVWPLIFKKANL